METLTRDLGQLSMQKQKAASFMDLIGSDTDSSYDQPITFQVVQDSYHISQGGQTIRENANIQIQIDDDNSIHYMHRYGITGDLIVSGGVIENALSLFDGLNLDIGNVHWNCAFQKYYAQQKLARLGKQEMQKVQNGLLLKCDDFGYSSLYNDATAWVGSANNALVQLDPIQIMMRQLISHYTLRSELLPDGTRRCKFFVPLSLIFPALLELPDDGAVYLSLGQKIKLNLKTNLATECVTTNGVNVAVAYEVRNISLVRFYSKLDPNRSDLVLKSSVVLPKLNYTHWQQSVIQGNVVNAIFPISAKDRIRGLFFGFHTRIPSTQNIGEVNSVAVNMTNGVAANFKSPLNYFPQMPIRQIDIDIGGHVYSINMSQIQFLHTSALFGDQKETYSHPIQRQFKYAYYIDLTRFGTQLDAYGSSSKSITSAHLQITLQPAVTSLSGQPQAGWDQQDFANFSFLSYLETLQMFECKNGLYQTF